MRDDLSERRPKPAGEPEGRTVRLNGYWAASERLAKRNDLFNKLIEQRYRVIALFGDESVNPYDDLLKIRREIDLAVWMLTEMDGKYGGDYLPTPERRSYEATIGWWTDPKEDIMSRRLDEIVERIEKVFRPAIQVTPPP